MGAYLHEEKSAQAVRITAVCAYCQMEAQAGKRPPDRITFPIPRFRQKRSRLHFCSKQHRALYYHVKRQRTVTCRQCGEIVQRRNKGVAFCDQACYAAWRAGRTVPNPRATDAERRIFAAWQGGVRGIRPLARESGASVNTVQKFIKMGKIG